MTVTTPEPRLIVETLPKNRRLELPAGTRYANALVHIEGPIRTGTEDEHKRRIEAETKARQIALDAWCEKWGPIPWDLAEITAHHLTIQVMVDVRVMP